MGESLAIEEEHVRLAFQLADRREDRRPLLKRSLQFKQIHRVTFDETLLYLVDRVGLVVPDLIGIFGI